MASAEPRLTEEKRARLKELSQHFPEVWNHPESDPKLKKRLLRAAINEILVRVDDEQHRLDVIIHWQGGVHSKIHVKRPVRRSGGSHESLEKLVRQLAELPDAEIARILNMKKISTPGGLRWTQDRIRNYRRQHHIRTKKARSGDSLTMNQTQEYLGVSHNGVLALVRRGAFVTNQITDFAPWRVSRQQLDSDEVQRLVSYLKQNGRLPKGGSPESQPPLFDAN